MLADDANTFSGSKGSSLCGLGLPEALSEAELAAGSRIPLLAQLGQNSPCHGVVKA